MLEVERAGVGLDFGVGTGVGREITFGIIRVGGAGVGVARKITLGNVRPGLDGAGVGVGVAAGRATTFVLPRGDNLRGVGVGVGVAVGGAFDIDLSASAGAKNIVAASNATMATVNLSRV